MYKLTNTTSITRLADNATIPADSANTDYQYYLKWIEEGNTPESLHQESELDIIARLEGCLDRHLDAMANSYRYESIRTMVSYATSEHPTFGIEGRAAVAFRDAVYTYGIQCISDVQNNLRGIPTEEELIAELPLFTDYLG
jgi:hypothetical protein